ncbi:hypothetical protein [Rubrivirga sp.]|uniref:hypothetical protein n=1 Tax=Rubrivirga sp. TaxID=1885344 RepID=UPI003B522712
MDDQAPKMPAPGERPQRAEDPVPDPHRTKPAPPPQEGMRPGVDPAVRPEQDEPLGPYGELIPAALTEAEQEAANVGGEDDPEAEALLAQMGVEEEGIESGQLLGLVAATLVSVAALAVILIYLFYIPFRTQVGERAEGQATNYEQEDLRTEAVAKLGQYTREDSTYGVPIGRAMGLVAAQYGGAGAAAGLPDSRQEWNTLPVVWGTGRAVQATPDRGQIEGTRFPVLGDGIEEVGVDRDVDTVERIENDLGEVDLDDAEALPDTRE